MIYKKKVSIIIPIYNSDKYIESTVKSVLTQTYDNFELLLLDDGSNDKSLEIINYLALIDSRIKVFSHENKGQSFTRNLGIKHSEGYYIAFLDSDDWWKENYLDEMITAIESSNTDLAICNYTVVNEINRSSKNIIQSKGEIKSNDEVLVDILRENVSHVCWGKLFKRKTIIDSEIIFLEGKNNEDLFTVFLWVLESKRVILLNSLLMFNRIRPHSITNTFNENFIDLIYVLEELKVHLILKEKYESLEDLFILKYERLLMYLCKYSVRMGEKKFINKIFTQSKISKYQMFYKNQRFLDKFLLLSLKINTNLFYYFTASIYFFHKFYTKIKFKLTNKKL